MPFKEMKFKGQRVFVEVDDAGGIIADKGRAHMKYRLESDQIYSPALRNLFYADGTPVDPGATIPAKPAPRKSLGKPSDKAPLPQNTSSQGKSNEEIVAYTDGACIGNPGPAGLGFLIRFPDGREIKRGEPLGKGTNNIAELTAILRVLHHVDNRETHIVIHTDSSYAIGVLTSGWKAKANRTLISEIKRTLAQFSNVALRKVKGHVGIPENELVDDLARGAAESQEPVE